MSTADRPRVFLDISSGTQPAGRLVIELFSDHTPRTAENFRQLCTGEYNGLSYAKAPLHRIIDEFMIQGGDVENGDGTGTASIYGGEFADENLEWRELDAPGLVCSANRGKDTNSCQWFITLDACPHLNGKHTVFGRLVSGDDVLRSIAKVAVDDTDRPVEPVLIARCGELARKEKKKRDSRQENAAPAVRESDDRGRRRKSDLSDNEMDAIPPPQQQQRRTRRQSDNIVDEGKRGRPRIRSRSRSDSNSQALDEAEEPASDHSSVKMHKRKRSQSPSRHLDRRSVGAETEHRRRRSLPNQYNNHRNRERDRGYGDEDRYRPSPRRDNQRYPGRKDSDSRYRSRYADEGRLGGGDDGRLGGGDSHDDSASAVTYKGRGAMKFREPDRAW